MLPLYVMKNKILLLALIAGFTAPHLHADDCPCDGGTAAYSVACGDGDADACETSECAVVASLTASDDGPSGSRSSETTLIMIDNGTRSATITGEVSGTLGEGYPKWEGSGISGSDGSMTATYSGTRDSTVTFHASPYSSQTIDIDLQYDGETTISIDTDDDWATSLESTIQGVLNYLMQDSDGDSFSLSGSMSGTMKKVDMYDDGETNGNSIKFEGTISATLAAAEFEGPPVPLFGGAVVVRAKAEFDAGTVELSADVEYDESQEDPFVGITGSLTFNQSVSVGAVATVGAVCDISYTASFDLSVGGTVSHSDTHIILTPSGSAGPVTGTLKVVGKLSAFECTLYSTQHTLYANTYTVNGSPINIYEL